jgi:hypothetical protein
MGGVGGGLKISLDPPGQSRLGTGSRLTQGSSAARSPRPWPVRGGGEVAALCSTYELKGTVSQDLLALLFGSTPTRPRLI